MSLGQVLLRGGVAGAASSGINYLSDSPDTRKIRECVKAYGAGKDVEVVKGSVRSAGKDGSDTIIKNGKVSIDDIKINPSAFGGKSAEEIVDVLRNSGYDVTIKNSTRFRSGAQIIQINNPGGGKNISQFRFRQEEGAMAVIHMLRLPLLTKELSKLLMELKVHIKQMEKKLQQSFFREVTKNVVRYFSTNSAI